MDTPRSLSPESLLAHEPFVRALVRGLLGDEARVADVLQETWLRALRRPPRATGSLRAWLARVATNLARDEQRSAGRRGARERAVARPEALESVEVTHTRLASQREVVDAVLALEEPYRSVVLLRYYQDQTPVEIAARLGRSPATVRSQLSRAHSLLRGSLDARFEGGRAAWAAVLLPALRSGDGAAAVVVLAAWVKVGAAVALVAALAVLGVRRLGGGEAPRLADPGLSLAADDAHSEAEPVQLAESSSAARIEVALSDAGSQPEVASAGPRWIARGHVRGAPAGSADQTVLTARFVGRYNIQDEVVAAVAPDGSFEFDVSAALTPWLRSANPKELLLTARHPRCLVAELRRPFEPLAGDRSPPSPATTFYDCEFELLAAAVVTGSVRLPADRAGLQAALSLYGAGEGPRRVRHNLDATTCDAEGRWILRASHGGEFTLLALAEGLRPTSRTVHLELGRTLDVGALEILPGVSISGRVLRSGVSVGAGAEVRATAQRQEGPIDELSAWGAMGVMSLQFGESGIELARLFTRTQADGSYRFDGLAPIDYQVQVTGLPGVRMSLGDSGGRQRSVRAPRSGVDLDSLPASVELRVTLQGRPPTEAELDGLVVELTSSEPRRGAMQLDLTGWERQPGGIEVVPGIEYALGLGPGRYAPVRLEFGPFVLGHQAVLELDLQPRDVSSTLSVTLAADQPVNLASAQFALVELASDGDAAPRFERVERSQEGTFVLANRAPGTYRVLVRPFDSWFTSTPSFYLATGFDVELAPRANVRREVRLELGGRLRAGAKDERGAFVQVPVELRDAAGRSIETEFYHSTPGQSLGCGWYLCGTGLNDHPPFSAGHYELTLTPNGFEPQNVPFEIRPGEITTLEVVLRASR